MELSLQSKIEGILFYKAEPIKKEKLAAIFSVSLDEVSTALDALEQSLSDRGIVIITKGDEVTIGTHSALGPIIETMRKDDISKELSKAALETLSIILYKPAVTRTELDYIRGVNSSFILRNLLVRGLVEKTQDKNDSRRSVYIPTVDLLSFMGVTRVEQLPNYEETKTQLENTLTNQTTND